MESNTFSTSAFIAVQPEEAYQYLCRLKNLDEWTLGSRMKEQVDADTWIGTASGYQRTLYYHVRRLENPRFRGIEWQCGYEYRKYFKSYPVLLFPPDYVEPGSTETGVYFHWVSVIDLYDNPLRMVEKEVDDGEGGLIKKRTYVWYDSVAPEESGTPMMQALYHCHHLTSK